jgi:hypothetical protein
VRRERPTEVGDSFFLAGVDDDFSVFCREYAVTAVRAGKVHLVEKNRWTFDGSGKLLAKVDDCWRRSFPFGVSGDFAHSRAGAYAKALPELENRARALAKIIATMKGQRTRSRPKAKRPASASLKGTPAHAD